MYIKWGESGGHHGWKRPLLTSSWLPQWAWFSCHWFPFQTVCPWHFSDRCQKQTQRPCKNTTPHQLQSEISFFLGAMNRRAMFFPLQAWHWTHPGEGSWAYPSLSLGRCASANVTSPACLMKSFRSYTRRSQSTHGEARDTSTETCNRTEFTQKERWLDFLRTKQATADKQDDSKNLGGRLITKQFIQIKYINTCWS